MGGRGHGGDGYSAREFVILIFFFFPSSLFLCSVCECAAAWFLRGERALLQCHFTPLFWSSAEGRCCKYPPPPSASLIPCLFLVLRRSVFDSFLFLFAKVRHAASAAVSKTQRGALLGNRRRRARAESQHGRKVSLGSSLRRSFLKILRRIERSAARTRICIQRLSVGGEKRPNWWNRYLVHGPDAAN